MSKCVAPLSKPATDPLQHRWQRHQGKRMHGGTFMKITTILIFASLCVIDASAVGQTNRKVTPDQGRMLVLASLSPQQRRLPSLEADPYEDRKSKFLFYTVTWAGTPDGSVVVGNYAVDPATGDVFSATAACDEQKNRKLQALQKRIRLALHLTDADYQKLKTKGPLCEE